MSDLKTFWDNPGAPSDVGLEGDTITSRGTDPNIDLGGENALQPLWSSPPVSTPQGEETENSVSGMPLQPNRFEPNETPPGPPTLTQRNPGTIDKQ